MGVLLLLYGEYSGEVTTLACEAGGTSASLVVHPMYECSSMVEQVPVKDKVAGSSPAVRAK